MKQYNLGPNGGILTSLNLFATRFDQVYAKHDPDIDALLLLPATIAQLTTHLRATWP